MFRLLNIAEFVCGSEQRHLVFEPMIADWQRELSIATSAPARARIMASGFTAFTWSLICCVIAGGVVMPRAVIVKAVTVLIASTIVLLTIQIGLNTFAIKRDLPLEARMWMALPMILPMAIPLALLPILMLMRASGRVSTRAAMAFVCTSAVAAYLTAAWLAPLASADFRDELHEAIYQRQLASDARGDVTYPGTARRQVRPTTAEQRAQAMAKWRSDPIYLRWQTEMTRPRWGRGSVLAAALALAMGGLGWAIGALRPSGLLHAGTWWAIAWFALVMMDGQLRYPGTPLQFMGRAPYWLPSAVFATAALAMSIAARRRHIQNKRIA